MKKEDPKYLFGDIVVVDEKNIGVVVKTWENHTQTSKGVRFNYEIYVRIEKKIQVYNEIEIERYKVRHKYLDEQELEWQNT